MWVDETHQHMREYLSHKVTNFQKKINKNSAKPKKSHSPRVATCPPKLFMSPKQFFSHSLISSLAHIVDTTQ